MTSVELPSKKKSSSYKKPSFKSRSIERLGGQHFIPQGYKAGARSVDHLSRLTNKFFRSGMRYTNREQKSMEMLS